MRSCVLALDLGTSNAKALVATFTGVPLAVVTRRMPYLMPAKVSPLARQMSPQRLWRLIGELTQESLGQAGLSKGEVAAVGITCQRQGMALLDKNGRELYLGPSLDLRAVFEGAALDDRCREELYRTTGHLPSFFLAPAKLRWFQLHRPGVYQRISSVLALADWVAYRFTGELVCEQGLAGELGLLDIAQRTWAKGLLSSLGLRSDWFPPLMPAGRVVGRMTSSAAAAIGLAPGTPVTVAGPDTQCGLLGMGVLRPLEMGIVAGWSATAQMVTSAPTFDPAMQTWTGLHFLPGHWFMESNVGDAGNAYDRLKSLWFGRARSAYEQMERQASGVAPGSEGVLASLGPAALDLSKPGLRTGGFFLPVPLTFSGMGRGHLVRAALENIAFALREAGEVLEGLVGAKASGLTTGGGMTRTALFSRILADVLGRLLHVSPTPHVSTLGAALVAATATGRFSDLEEAAQAASQNLTLLSPDSETALVYQAHYQRWREARHHMERFPLL